MQIEASPFRLKELSTAPEAGGVYAWYYQIELSNRDIEVCAESIEAAPDRAAKAEILRRFLSLRLFRYFKESPYDVTLKGKMKPTYRGEVENEQQISDSLLNRLVEDPQRLFSLKHLLTASIPIFASPIYIGIAKNLRVRLLRHGSLITRYQNALTYGFEEVMREGTSEDVEAKRDHSFAQEVTKIRNFSTNNLLVYTMQIDLDDGVYLDLENILNRINFPLCGRN